MDLIRASITLAFSRTGTEFDKDLANNIYADVIEAYPKLQLHEFLTALKLGGIGKYGKTYKLTVQEVCIWVQTYLNESRPKFCYD
jgi:hypothetical protein